MVYQKVISQSPILAQERVYTAMRNMQVEPHPETQINLKHVRTVHFKSIRGPFVISM